MKALDWLENFYFKYFSNSTIPKFMWVRYLTVGIMMIPFTLGMLGIIMGFIDLTRFFVHMLLWMLVPFVVGWIIVYFYYNNKLKKLQKRWK